MCGGLGVVDGGEIGGEVLEFGADGLPFGGEDFDGMGERNQ